MRRTVAGVFVVSFATLLTVLLVQSRELFTKVIYEEGDFAANSIITYQAKHFELLVGNYSRVGFSHPGPAFFYVQAAGEWLFHDLLGIVPSAWNGQAIGILTLNAACVALALTVLYLWFHSVAAVVAAGGGFLAFVAAHDQLFSSTWMPFAYFAPFLLLLVAGASVYAGRLRHLWLLVFAGSLLVHGHASFLFFVPLIGLSVLWRHRRAVVRDARVWGPAAGVAGLFLVPIVLDFALHFPGQFPRYVGYGARGLHLPWDSARYQLQFWASNPVVALAVVVGLFAAVRLIAHFVPHPDAAHFLRAGFRTTAVATGLFLVYAIYGIDNLHEPYIGYFSRAMPLSLIMFALAGAAALVPRTVPGWRVAVNVAGAAVLAVGLVAAMRSIALVNRRGEVPGVPVALDVMTARAGDRPILLEVRPDEAWAEAVPILVAGLRRHHRVCMVDQRWRLLATAEFLCTPDELATGERFVVVRRDHAPAGPAEIANVSPSLVYPANALP